MIADKVKFSALVHVAIAVFVLGIESEIFAQSHFYRSKTVTVIVGSAPGGLYDLWARLLARTMGKYIPGNPNMLVQNMPGAGSMVAATGATGAVGRHSVGNSSRLPGRVV